VKSKDRGTPVTSALNWTDYDEQEARRQINAITLEEAIRELDTILANLHINPVSPSSLRVP
jgi:hypothetical protein